MDITYWYLDKKGALNFSTIKPAGIPCLEHKISSIGIPTMKAVQYKFNDKIINKNLPNEKVGNVDMIKNLLGVK
jgi:hypothetical protein